MSAQFSDLPAYVTVVRIGHTWHVNRMEYDTRAGDYIVTGNLFNLPKTEIEVREQARKWAESQGLEVR